MFEQRTVPCLIHVNSDGKCDTCGKDLGTKPPVDPSATCTHLCHKTGFKGFIWKIINLFNKLFKINQYCECGAKHW
ncbi:MAG: hypothetical protein MJ177_06535 [Clostridia bacterium]|nr:hypothetical protein [Clostridia bacterium]